jgi:hypothetical protein
MLLQSILWIIIPPIIKKSKSKSQGIDVFGIKEDKSPKEKTPNVPPAFPDKILKPKYSAEYSFLIKDER